MVDRTLLARKVASIRDHLARIRSLGPISAEQFKSDPNSQDIILFRLERIIQDCIDIACHVVADENWGVPESYREAFSTLGDRLAISAGLASFMVETAGFRNILVHGYEKMNMSQAYEIYSQRDRFDDFCDAILKYSDVRQESS